MSKMESACGEILYEAKTIRQILRDGKNFKRMNILVVGNSDAGRASFINSMLMAINPKGFNQLNIASPKIGYIYLFSNLIESASEHKYICQPMMVDAPLISEYDDNQQRLVLTMIKHGYDLTSIDMHDLQKWSVRDLQYNSFCKDEEKQIDGIVIVSSAANPLSQKIFNIIRKAALPEDPEGRAIPAFGIVHELDGLDENELQDIRNRFAEGIGLEEKEWNQIISTELYCDKMTPEYDRNQIIDKNMCCMWSMIIQALTPVTYRKVKVVKKKTVYEYITHNIKMFWGSLNIVEIPAL